MEYGGSGEEVGRLGGGVAPAVEGPQKPVGPLGPIGSLHLSHHCPDTTQSERQCKQGESKQRVEGSANRVTGRRE